MTLILTDESLFGFLSFRGQWNSSIQSIYSAIRSNLIHFYVRVYDTMYLRKTRCTFSIVWFFFDMYYVLSYTFLRHEILHTYKFVHWYVCTICVYVWDTYACKCGILVSMCVHVFCACTCMHMYMHESMRALVCVCVYIYIYIHTYIHTYSYIICTYIRR